MSPPSSSPFSHSLTHLLPPFSLRLWRSLFFFFFLQYPLPERPEQPECPSRLSECATSRLDTLHGRRDRDGASGGGGTPDAHLKQINPPAKGGPARTGRIGGSFTFSFFFFLHFCFLFLFFLLCFLMTGSPAAKMEMEAKGGRSREQERRRRRRRRQQRRASEMAGGEKNSAQRPGS